MQLADLNVIAHVFYHFPAYNLAFIVTFAV